jgi:hypothetical protein
MYTRFSSVVRKSPNIEYTIDKKTSTQISQQAHINGDCHEELERHRGKNLEVPLSPKNDKSGGIERI